MNEQSLETMHGFKKIMFIVYLYTIGLLLKGLKFLGNLVIKGITGLFRAYGSLQLLLAFWQKGVGEEVVVSADKEAEMSFIGRLIERFKRRVARSIYKHKNWTHQDSADFLINNAIYIVILGLILVVIIQEPMFLSVNVFRNILTQSSVRLILAFGVGGIIILQGTDLSLGRSVGFAAIISASLLQAPDYASRFYTDLPQLPLFVPLIIVMIVAAFFSAINGFVVSVFKIHPFLATLGASVALFGLLSMYFASGDPGPQPIGGFDSRYVELVTGQFNIFGLEIPRLIVYATLVTIGIWILWNKTTYGKNMYAVGGNPEAAKISGVSVVKTTIMVYIVAGLLYGLGGYLEAARIGSASNGTGFNYELDAIAACVVGGISFSGGIGKVSGAVAGVLMFTIISYGMNFLGLDVFYQYIIKGVIIVAAVALDTRKYLIKT
jgi:methyl-galactoside transport system permease protein